ncbi:type 4a pilus biogenesis protein PilO [Patescibacteria group bacterium]|nr:type 4a pilus biogenesis protein PilO [Patescibacteria group bacterium]MBU4512471.1 type 4a pilus biogenesis protein PilO [Patescibacteria group bacterium]MCG2692599.1 type 4a pilus biogenesis protein PilO [Candidatus Parcubacteria bacterium]
MMMKNRLYFIAGILLLLVGVVVFVIRPTARELKELSATIKNQRENLKKLYPEGQQIETIQAEYQQIKPKFESLSSIFVAPGKELDLITALEKIAAENNIEQEIDLRRQDPKTESAMLPFHLTLSGNFHNLISYLLNLEALEYYIKIGSLSINSDTAQSSRSPIQPISDPEKISASIQASAYTTNYESQNK